MRDPEVDDERPGISGDGSDEASFLRRWSRRKRGLDKDDPTTEIGDPPPAEATPETALTDADMQDLASISAETDISPFFSREVSEDLRQAALKRLFSSAKFNVRDGLDDYDEDYRSFHPLGDIVTREWRRQLERQEERRRNALPAGEDPEAPAEEPEPLYAADEGDRGEDLAPDRGEDEDEHERS